MGWLDERKQMKEDLTRAIEGVPVSFNAKLFALCLVAEKYQLEKLYGSFPTLVLFFRDWKEGRDANPDKENNDK